MRGKALEADYTRTVVEMAQRFGWKVAHHPDSRKLVGDPGVPDIVCVRAGRVVFLELKIASGRLSADQRDWHAELSEAGVEVAVLVLPAQFELVERVLR